MRSALEEVSTRRLSSVLRRFVPLMAILCTAAFWAQSPLAAQGLTIEGSVTSSDGTPMAGVAVTLHPIEVRYRQGERLLAGGTAAPPVAEGITDAQGRLRLRAPEIGMWQVQLRSAGKVPLGIRLAPLLESIQLPTAMLLNDQRVTLQILDTGDRPVANAAVRAYRRQDEGVPKHRLAGRQEVLPQWRPVAESARTDSAGFVQLVASDQEVLRVQVVAAGFPPAVGDFQHRGRAPWRFVLPAAIHGSLRVIDERGRAAPDTLVFTDRQPMPLGKTDEQGRLPLDLELGQPVLISLSTAEGRWGVFTVTARLDQQAEVEMVLQPPTVARGRVLDHLTRQPLAGALVWPSRLPARFGFTARDGTFEVIAGRGERLLTAGMAGYRLAQVASDRMQLDSSADPKPVAIFLQPVAAVSGWVIDAGGEPVAGVSIAPLPPGLVDADAVAETAEDGSFYLDQLFAGVDYRFQLSSPRRGDRSPVAVTRVEEPALAAGEMRSELVWQLTPARDGEGWVVDEEDRPVAGATVELARVGSPSDGPRSSAPPDLFTAATDSQGRYFVAALPPARYDLKVRAAGYAPVRVPGIALAAEELGLLEPWPLGTVMVSPASFIEGKVETPEGRGIEAAKIEVRGVGMLGMRPGEVVAKLEADAEGRFRLGDLAAGEALHLKAQAEGFLQAKWVKVKAPDSQVRLVVEHAAMVEGRVVNHLGWPIAGAQVNFRAERPYNLPVHQWQRTDETGFFALADVEPGKGKLIVTADSYRRRQIPLALTAGDSVTEVEVELDPGYLLTGHARTHEGEPVAHARISAHHGNPQFSQSTTADADGAFTLRGLEEGSLQLHAERRPLVSVSRSLVIDSAETYVEVRFDSGHPVSGRVINGKGETARNALVAIIHDQGLHTPAPVSIADDGSFLFQHVKAGSYRLRAMRSGKGRSQDYDLEVHGPVSGVELTLADHRDYTVTGHIEGLSHEDLSAVYVRAFGDGVRHGSVAYDGSFEVPGVFPGQWQLVARVAAAGRAAKVDLTVAQDQPPAPQVLRFDSGFTVAGQVIVNGQLAAGYSLSLSGPELFRNLSSFHDGSFSFQSVPAGDYRLELRGPNRERLSRRISVASDTELRLDFQTTVVAGKVASEDFASLQGVTMLLIFDDSTKMTLSTTSRQDGAFVFAAVEAGRWRLEAHLDGFATGQQALQVTPPVDLTGIEVVLKPVIVD